MNNFKHRYTHRWLSALIGLTAGLALSTSAMAFDFGGGDDPSDDFADRGPFSTTSHSGGFSCTIFRPTSGSNHPVIIWGNGTGTSPSTYSSGLDHWASHGFVVAAANTSNAGTGEAMLGCLSWVNSNLSMADASRVGASGHSQGGGGAIMAGRSSAIDTTAPMQPFIQGLGYQPGASTQQNGPMLLLSGSSDSIASEGANQEPVFENTNVPVFWASRTGASHFEPTGNFGDFRGISTAWFLSELQGDSEARELFRGACTMCDASGWDINRRGL